MSKIRKCCVSALLAWCGTLGLQTEAEGRSIYLNGIDVSSARSQNLKNVNVRIDEHGNIFLEAAHYRVHEQAHYTPLSRWISDTPSTKHRAPQTINSRQGAPVDAPLAPASDPEILLEKAGERR